MESACKVVLEPRKQQLGSTGGGHVWSLPVDDTLRTFLPASSPDERSEIRDHASAASNRRTAFRMQPPFHGNPRVRLLDSSCQSRRRRFARRSDPPRGPDISSGLRLLVSPAVLACRRSIVDGSLLAC